MVLNYETAKKELLTSAKCECQNFFYDNGFLTEAAYAELLNNNLPKAKKLFQVMKNQDSRARWGMVLTGLIEGLLHEPPTYFGIRNFLEIDLDILINHGKGEYVEKILTYSDFMSKYNPEVYKYIGRVFLNNDIKPQAKAMLMLAKDCFYNDPELQYLIAEMYYKEKDFENAEKHINNCLNVLPEYFPAIQLKKFI